MRATTKRAKSAKAVKASKRADRGVPFEEMRRLMSIYGSMKCLRRRQNPGGEDTKIDSVKRKFYRWFPDLEDRFVKDKDGCYQPKAGHEFEMRYREEMRSRDGKVLVKKRAKCRKERHGGAEGKPQGIKEKATSPDLSSTDRAPVSPDNKDPADDEALSAPPFCNEEASILGTDITLKLDQDDPSSCADVVADTEPVDRSFIAERGIFDDVEKSFFGVTGPVPGCSGSQVSSCSSSSDEPALMDLNSSWDRLSSSSSLDELTMEDMLNRSMEECCEKILGSSDDNESVSEYVFDMITN